MIFFLNSVAVKSCTTFPEQAKLEIYNSWNVRFLELLKIFYSKLEQIQPSSVTLKFYSF